LASITKSHESLRSFAMGNVIGNILIFIPMGIYLSLFKKDKRLLGNLIIIALISTIVELIQWSLGIGILDIDDVILNSFGGWLGILIYKVLCIILHDEKKVSSAVTIQSAIIGLPVTFYLLFMVQMRF
jgi:glycopeptide antibiotics resistance protein